ncbi:hypothetical protein HYT53_02420 [Candidatus Woesearchaeota archaeon]|nr:hypothetical protein [Candidatus Woesearchaeota archaeon]
MMRKELAKLGILFLLFILIFKIIYFNESFFVVFRAVIAIFWMFALPGYFLMLYWHEKLEFLERLIAGIALSAAVIGISSYYAGLIGLNIKYHTIILPAVLIVLGIIINFRKQ